MKRILMTMVTISALTISAGAEDSAKHLFILSGQSNMAALRPEEVFTPAVKAAFGQDSVIVVRNAQGGQLIRRWYRNWKAPTGDQAPVKSDLYDRLMGVVNAKIKGHTLASVTFIWMQGEADAGKGYGDVYADALRGLYQQLSEDLQRDDINFVIGRLSDFGMENKHHLQWIKVRDAQVEVAESNDRFAWVDTDDLNDGLNNKGVLIKNGLHYSVEGYRTLARRFAEKALALINANATDKPLVAETRPEE